MNDIVKKTSLKRKIPRRGPDQAVKDLRVQGGGTLPRPTSVKDSFGIAQRIINAAVQHLGQKQVLLKLERVDWHLNTWFAGCLFGELGAASFVATATEYVKCHQTESNRHRAPHPVLRWGPAVDKASSTTQLVKKIWRNCRCVIGPEAEELVNVPRNKLQQLKVQRLHVTAGGVDLRSGKCSVHERTCAADFTGPPTSSAIDWVTFPCPPWSRQGKRLQEKDRRFDCFKAWALSAHKRTPDMIVAENVVGVPTDLLDKVFPGYTMKVCILDSRILGLPMSRDRVIFIGVRDGCRRWVDDGKTLAELIHMIAASQDASNASGHPHLQPQHYFEFPDSECFVPLTDGEAHQIMKLMH